MDFFNDIFNNIIYILLYIDFILSIFFQHSNIWPELLTIDASHQISYLYPTDSAIGIELVLCNRLTLLLVPHALPLPPLS